MQVELEDYARGAALATALVNTSGEVMLRTGDALQTPDDLTAFLTQHDIQTTVGPADLTEVLALRSRLRTIIDTAITGNDASADLEALIRHGELVLSAATKWALRTGPNPTLAQGLALLTGVGLLGVLRALSQERFRPCADDTCRGVFVDSSRAGRRRYCMPDICGNRANVARYRSRHRNPPTP